MTANGKSAEEMVGLREAGALRGMTPSLIEVLASLGEEGNTVEDLTVTLQLFPYGDRVTLHAYGYVEKKRPGLGDRGVERWVATPKMVELTEAAHQLRDHLTTKATGHAILDFLEGR